MMDVKQFFEVLPVAAFQLAGKAQECHKRFIDNSITVEQLFELRTLLMATANQIDNVITVVASLHAPIAPPQSPSSS